jgi:hypothetical protein
MSVSMTSLGNYPPLRPGFLVGPLGWLNECLAKILTRDRELLGTLFELDPYRMHALGLGVAHLDPARLSRTIIEGLAGRSPQTSVRQILGNWPQGLDRILHALPGTSVLAPENYRALVTLLHDRATAAHLHHCHPITEPFIIALAALPPPLRRPAIFKLFDDIDGMDRFVAAGLEFLSDRAGVAFKHLVEELGSLDQTEQVRAKITALADRLPLPDRLPAEQLGTFHRIDDPAQIRSLAKSWHNCLGEYLHEVNEGTSLIYRSTEDDQPTAALLARANRLGWALVDIKGPKNIDIHPKTASRQYETFSRAGIPRLADIAAIRSLLWRTHLSRHR